MNPQHGGAASTRRPRFALLAVLLVAAGALAWPTMPGAGATAAGHADVLDSGLVYTPLPYTCRIIDTRIGFGAVGVGQRANTYHGHLTGDCDVPDDRTVRAVMVNVIAVGARGTGYIRAAAYPFAQNTALTVVNFNDGLVASNALPLTLCDDRVGAFVCEWDVDFTVYGGSTHIVVDLLGYIAPPRTPRPPEP